MDTALNTADILTTLRKDVSAIIREEMKGALAEEFDDIKKEIQAVRSEVANNVNMMRAEIARTNTNVKAVQDGLLSWSDELVCTQNSITDLKKEVEDLKEKCGGRMRRGNNRIVGVDEGPNSSSPAAISKLLKEVFQMDKEVRIERSHHSLIQRKPGDKPRAIIAKLHSEGDAMDILRRAWESRGCLTYNGHPIAIKPKRERSSLTSER